MALSKKQRALSPRKRTIENSPAIHRWDWQGYETKSVKRAAGEQRTCRIIQSSASRTKHPSAPFPSSELLGYYHSSALRTGNLTFLGKSGLAEHQWGRRR
jgi:hypothetical protein